MELVQEHKTLWKLDGVKEYFNYAELVDLKNMIIEVIEDQEQKLCDKLVAENFGSCAYKKYFSKD